MIWNSIVEISVQGKVRRFRVDPSKNPNVVHSKTGYTVMVNEIDLQENIIDRFDFFIDIKNNIISNAISNSDKPVSIITESMEKLVKRGLESW